MATKIGANGVLALFLLTACPVLAAGPSALCYTAARAASAETGVPLPILTAILLAESGRKGRGGLEPWPWTLHAEGRGQWFDTRSAGEARLSQLQEASLTNIDIGCFQINLRWHGAAYPAANMLFDPMTNARHAAGYLAELHRITGDWRQAASRYHSRDPDRAEAYARRLEMLHAAATGQGAPPVPGPQPSTRAGQPRGPLIDLAQRARPLVGAAP